MGSCGDVSGDPTWPSLFGCRLVGVLCANGHEEGKKNEPRLVDAPLLHSPASCEASERCRCIRPYLSVFVEVELEWFDVVVEAEGHHRRQNVVPVDGLAFLRLALVARPEVL